MHGLHVRKVSVLVPVTAICVISSAFLISANISKPVLVTASTVSVISDVTMQKPMSVIDKLAPFKTNQVKGNSQEWFDGEVLESIALRDKLFKKFKRSKLNVDKEIYNKARNKSHRLILQKREYFENKLKENIAKPKDLWFIQKNFSCSNKCN